MILTALHSFLTTRRLQNPRLSRRAFQAEQARALRHWLDHKLPQVAAYTEPPKALADLPVMDKAQLMARFADFNRARITTDQVAHALQSDGRIGKFTAGASSGTTGNRGYFVIDDAERYRWLGTLLAKAMADLLTRPQRVAIILPQTTRLYDSARSIPWLRLRFFNLSDGVGSWHQALQDFAPTIIVAPPKILRHLAETGVKLSPLRVFSAAETLDPVDAQVIAAAYPQPLGQIYMASEGLLGVTCPQGRLHLAEDSVFFEYEPVGDHLVSPLITCFRRDFQIMARYRMNDLLRLDPAPCPCGSPLQVAAEVVGRMDDIFHFGPIIVTPDILRNAVLAADRRISDFRILQQTETQVDLILPPDLPDDAAQRARQALSACLTRAGAKPDVALLRQDLPLDTSRKLRRVARVTGQ
jgi:putative adenylate-forming enzyme